MPLISAQFLFFYQVARQTSPLLRLLSARVRAGMDSAGGEAALNRSHLNVLISTFLAPHPVRTAA